MGVLHRHHGDRHLMIGAGVDDVHDRPEVEFASFVVHQGELDRCVARRRAHLEADHVLVATGDDDVARPRQHAHRDLVRHHARGDEHRRLLAHQIGEAFLEFAHRGVVTESVVADHGARHRLAHRGGRLGDGVGTEVYGAGHGKRLASAPRLRS